MNYEIVPEPEKMKEWKGKFVVSKYPVQNFYMTMPAGTIFQITNEPTVNKYLESTPCKCCQLKGKFVYKGSRVNFLRDFRFIELKG